MVDIITKIMVEVLNVLGFATKEIRQGRMSKLLLYNRVNLPLTEPFSEKYLKRLIGRTDIEDALKRLDRLTQEEARMAAAQVLKVANTVDGRVQGIADNMLSVDNRVGSIGERVTEVGDRLKEVDEQVKGVNDQVTGVDERVKDVNDHVKDVNDQVKDVNDHVEEARVVIQQTADDVDQVKRS
jgi:methyl-accepting chemotaxis protein